MRHMMVDKSTLRWVIILICNCNFMVLRKSKEAALESELSSSPAAPGSVIRDAKGFAVEPVKRGSGPQEGFAGLEISATTPSGLTPPSVRRLPILP